MIRRPPRSTPLYSSAASDVYKRQALGMTAGDQPVAKPSIGRTEDGPGHGCCHAIVAATLIRGWDYPNMGYHQCLRPRTCKCLRRALWLHWREKRAEHG